MLVWGPGEAGSAGPSPEPATPDAQLSTPGAERPPSAIWRAKGLTAPRCVRVDAVRRRVYVLGTDGGLHQFDLQGRHCASVALPLERDGNPQGMAIDADGNLLVADTHASRVLRLSPEGRLLATYGRLGDAAGEYHWPTAVAEAADRTLWVSEYGMTFDGDHDRLHHLRSDGTPLAVFGGTGDAPGKFYRPSNLAIDGDGNIWVADACNHRLQVLAPNGAVLRVIDGTATAAGPLRNPYDLVFDGPDTVLVAEFGASRVRRLRRDGTAAEFLVGPGRAPGQVATPWGCAALGDRLLVADTGNQRLQAVTWRRSADGLRTAARAAAAPGSAAGGRRDQ